jgi:hypothetical protein
MSGARKQTCFLHNDKLLAKFEALSDNDTSNSESDSNSESEVEEICDNFESDSPQDAAEHTKGRRTAGPSFWWQIGNFVQQIHDFDNQNSGISANLDENCSVFDIFKLFFPFKIMQNIAEQTNSYYKFLCQKLPPTPHSRLQSWAETTAEELYICNISHTCQILNYCGKWYFITYI